MGEVASLLPEDTYTMALTATATRSSRQVICKVLGMKNCVVISKSPNKPNICYRVQQKPTLEEAFGPLIAELRQKRQNMDRVIIFGQTYNDSTYAYMLFHSSLGKEATHPVGAPDLPKYRIVDMFTACTQSSIKDAILEQYKNPVSCLRIVIATIAFGMGLDCPNVRQIIHWGVPSDVESYLQETGRAGRDGQQSQALLYYSGSDFCGGRVDVQKREYCTLTDEKCRREFLLQDFDKSDSLVCVPFHSCCDNCVSKSLIDNCMMVS